MPGTLLLVDSPSMYFRTFFGVPPRSAPDGTPTNAVAGFLDRLARLIDDREPDRVCCVLDNDWRPAWRVAILPSYKTHRVAGDARDDAGGAPPGQAEPPELGVQVPILETALRAAGIAVCGADGYEADDVIATLAARERPPVEIVTGDRDLFQLVRDPDVAVLYPAKGGHDRIDEAAITTRYGIPGRSYADLAILRGDASDGLPGVRGVGDKTAAQLLAKYGSLEDVMAAAEEKPLGPLAKVKSSREYLEAAIKVVRLPDDIALPALVLDRPDRPADEHSLLELAKRYNLAGPVKRLTDALYR